MHKEEKNEHIILPGAYDENLSPMANLRRAVEEALPYADEYQSTVTVGARFGTPRTYKEHYFRNYRPMWQLLFVDRMGVEEAGKELGCGSRKLSLVTMFHIRKWIKGEMLMERYSLNEDLREKLMRQKNSLFFLSEDKVKELLGDDMELFTHLMSVHFSKRHFGKRYVLPEGSHKGYESVIRNVPKVMISNIQPLEVSRIRALMDPWNIYSDDTDMDETIRIFLENEEWIEKTDDGRYIAAIEKNEYIASILNS